MSEYRTTARAWHRRQISKLQREPHKCCVSTVHAVHGPAVSGCFEDEDGVFWVTNFEYASAVPFCPFCGTASRTTVAKSEQGDAAPLDREIKLLFARIRTTTR